jgi:hypothetical protein
VSPRRRSHRRHAPVKVPRPPADIGHDRTAQPSTPAQVKNAKSATTDRDTSTRPVGAGFIKSRTVLGVPLWQAGLLLLLTIVLFLLYLKTTARSVPTGDSGELIAAAWNLGVAHPPGYPTYTILGHLAGLFPIGTPAFRLNLLSAILDSLALGVLGFGILRFLRARTREYNKDSGQLIPIIGALIGISLLAISTAYWSYSLVAEVFALNNLFAALALVLMMEWFQRPTQHWFLWISGLFSGLAITNQLTFVLLAPALIFLLIWGLLRWRRESLSTLPDRRFKHKTRDPGWQIRNIGACAGFFVLGLLPYIYLPIAASRDPLVNWGDPRNLSNFWHVIMRSDYGTFSFSADSIQGDRFQQLTVIGKYFVNSFTPVGILLAALGIVWFVRKRRPEGIGLGLAFLFSGPIFAIFANPLLTDPLTQGVFERFYILPSIPFTIFIAVGAAYLLDVVKRLADRAGSIFWPRMAITAGLVIVIALPVGMALTRLPTLDMSNNRIAEYYGTDLLSTLEPNSVLLMRSDENYTAVVYMQTVLGYRTDVAAFDVELLKLSSYVDKQHRLYPEVIIPFSKYDEGVTSSLVDLVNSNLGQRPVYGVGVFKEDLTQSLDKVYVGLAYQFVKKGDGSDSYTLLRSESDRFTSLHFPEQVYPSTSWEAVIARHYGTLAFQLAFARQKPEAQPDADFVEKMYRIAILNDPYGNSAYKNLGLVLWQNSGSPTEIIALWQKYLQLVPDDPDAEEMRSVMKTLQEESK